ncbi:nucleoside hydrolase [Herbiconiux moechotypicola]|uniref:nucleoside hydrolase n=1 Tax=Herbiconiux moechotypicola TaxID=637393 RepID=UPI00217DFD74|nr:nucleoside hydrolase [Herbiconiux moechotypicola]MCS5728952.1 nucleoside hydrolase [Herbiconiux moechotypicola]
MTHRVLLDVDTGVDDALALLFAVAHPEIELIGVTCVSGNTTLENVVQNTLAILDVAGAPETPVAAGARRPLIEPARSSHVHGGDGMGDLGLPSSRRPVDPRHGVDLARDLILGSDQPVTLVTVAPQTNVALLLRQYPEVAEALDRIVFMGGAAGVGNATAVAEFNVWHDPEAAAITIDSGVQTFMYGLDVFNQVGVARSDVDALLSGESAAARIAGRLLDFQADGAHIGDAGALCALVDPGALHVERHPVRVELAGASRGQTVVDRRPRVGEDAVHGLHTALPLVDVALDIDAPRVARLFVETVTTLP